MMLKIRSLGILILLMSLLCIETQAIPPPASVNPLTAINVAPSVSFDGQQMVFMSDRGGAWELYLCTRQGDKWSDPVAIEAINKWVAGSRLSSPYLNYNGSRLYFATDKGSVGGLDIYVAERQGDTWTTPVNLGAPINTAIDEEWPSLSLNEKVMFFTRTNQEEKKPCSLMYQASCNAEGRWQRPAEMRTPINESCSKSPRVSADGKTVYFSSNRRGLDYFEMFYTMEILPDVWMIPQPMDFPNKDKQDLLSATPDPSRKSIYLEASKLGDRKPKGSIKELELPAQFRPECVATVKGKVSDMFSGKPLPAKVELSDLNTFVVYNSVPNNPATGEYNIILPKGREYQLDIYNDNSSHAYSSQDMRELKDDAVITHDAKLSTYVSLTLNVYDGEIFTPLDAKITVKDVAKNENISVSGKHLSPGRIQFDLPIGRNYLFTLEMQNYAASQFPFDMHKVVQFLEYERDIIMNIETESALVKVTDATNGAAIEGAGLEIDINNLDYNQHIVARGDEVKGGQFSTKLRKGNSYEVKVTGPKGYAFFSTKVKIDNSFFGLIDAKLAPLVAQAAIALNNITFETNSADLNESSFEELGRLLKLMNDNPDINVELSAHTDDVGSVPYNNRLSEKRAATVVAYMLEHGIPATRITSKGYGSSQPLVPNTSDENRAKNRRVEFKITEITQ